jgi:hypothetical protein
MSESKAPDGGPVSRAEIALPGAWPGTITEDPRGRLRIYLGRSNAPITGWREVKIMMGRKGRRRETVAWVHPAATSGGWAWLPRFVVWRETGCLLRADEHVHHECQDRRCFEPDHLRVVTPQFHGRLHAYATLLFRLRDARGRWVPGQLEIPLPEPHPRPYAVPRFGPIIGNAARA